MNDENAPKHAALVAQLRGLTEVSRTLTNATSVDEVLEFTVDKALDLLAAERVVLMLNGEDGLLSVRASRGVTPDVAEAFREPLSETLAGRLSVLLGEGARFLGVPLVSGGVVTGLLAVGLAGEKDAPELGELILSALADQAAVALERARLGEIGEFRERLLGIVSHDLKNPLSAIDLSVKVLQADGGLSARQAMLVSRIGTSTDRMFEMIRQLIDFTRGRLGGGIPVSPEEVALNDICGRVVGEYGVTYPDRYLHFTPASVSTGYWDPARLEQVVSNLVGNALQHGEADSTVEVVVDREAHQTCFSVHSKGELIHPDQIPKLFDPFSGKDARSSHHLGLGLYITKEIVDSHGGTISVTSDAERGTVFTVCLPNGIGGSQGS